ncbi:carboxypeptidase B-like [Anopheles stephensi]|uniref:carboxypeptidase B-like n=1 Tax=Anopheles stephensi TaxID=30069 RepID=UPI00165890CB|nr:carboxypeptidase B-like [Anopheles stephensi]
MAWTNSFAILWLSFLIILPANVSSNETVPRSISNDIDPSYVVNHFLSYDETNDFMHKLAELFPSKVKVEQLGVTSENRAINMLVINYLLQRTVILVANLQSEEWAAMTSTIYITEQLLYNVEQYPDLSQFRWMIIPISNPDGYEYTREYDRYWNKNRSPQLGGSFGVDLNANFGYMWGENEQPIDPSDRLYNGPIAFSEAETVAISGLMQEMAERVVLFVDMHTFGNHIFHPWASTLDEAPNALTVEAVAVAGAEAIRVKFGEQYTVGTPALLLEKVYGTCLDYCQSLGIHVCLWFELTNNGHIFEPDKIVLYGNQAWTAIKEMVLRANDTYEH